MTLREIAEFNKELHLVPLSRSTLGDGYIAVVRSVINSVQTEQDFVSPFRTVRLTARAKVRSEPLSGCGAGSFNAPSIGRRVCRWIEGCGFQALEVKDRAGQWGRAAVEKRPRFIPVWRRTRATSSWPAP
jgi:hypothetical protein